MENLKNYYTSGEFAEAIGTTKDTLFHYDRIGLFSPEYKGSNGYRYYSRRQLGMFVDIQSLRNVGMELKDIKRYMDNRSLINYIELLSSQTDALRARLHHLEDVIYDLESSLRYAREAVDAGTGFKTEECGDKYGIRTLSEDEAFGKDFLSFWKRIHSGTEYVSNNLNTAVSIDKLTGPGYSYDYLYADINGTPEPGSDIVRRKGLYLTGYHHGDDDSIISTYREMFRYAREQGLRPGKMAYEEYLVYEIAVTDGASKITKLYIELEP